MTDIAEQTPEEQLLTELAKILVSCSSQKLRAFRNYCASSYPTSELLVYGVIPVSKLEVYLQDFSIRLNKQAADLIQVVCEDTQAVKEKSSNADATNKTKINFNKFITILQQAHDRTERDSVKARRKKQQLDLPMPRRKQQLDIYGNGLSEVDFDQEELSRLIEGKTYLFKPKVAEAATQTERAGMGLLRNTGTQVRMDIFYRNNYEPDFF